MTFSTELLKKKRLSPLLPLIAASMAGELEKIAVRWKDALRTGEIGAAGRARLLQAGLLDYGREGAGLARGNAELIRKMKVPLEEVPSAADDVKGVLHAGLQFAKARKLPSEDETDQILQALKWHWQLRKASQGGMASVSLPTGGGSVITNKKGKFLKGVLPPESQQQLDALVARHELDELRVRDKERNKILRKSPNAEPAEQIALVIGNRKNFLPIRRPKNIVEKVIAENFDPQGRKNISKKIVEYTPNKLKKYLNYVPIPGTSQKGSIVAGQHPSPDIILRENRNLATLSPEVAQAVRPYRVGEEYTLAPYGFEYGKHTTPEVRKSILKAFDKGEI